MQWGYLKPTIVGFIFDQRDSSEHHWIHGNDTDTDYSGPGNIKWFFVNETQISMQLDNLLCVQVWRRSRNYKNRYWDPSVMRQIGMFSGWNNDSNSERMPLIQRLYNSIFFKIAIIERIMKRFIRRCNKIMVFEERCFSAERNHAVKWPTRPSIINPTEHA